MSSGGGDDSSIQCDESTIPPGNDAVAGIRRAGIDPEDDHPCGILRASPDAFARPRSRAQDFPASCRYCSCMLGRREREQEQGQLEQLLSESRSRIHELEAQMRARNESDPVTGLNTLDRMRNQLDIEASRARRHDRPLSVAVLDIDGFRALCA